MLPAAMTGYLRALAGMLLVGGIIVCALATQKALGDEAYYRAAFAFERHADHILYQLEYQAALVRHVAYIVTAVVSGMGGVFGSAILFALAGIRRRLERAGAAPAR